MLKQITKKQFITELDGYPVGFKFAKCKMPLQDCLNTMKTWDWNGMPWSYSTVMKKVSAMGMARVDKFGDKSYIMLDGKDRTVYRDDKVPEVYCVIINWHDDWDNTDICTIMVYRKEKGVTVL